MFLLVATSLTLQVTSHTLYITPDDHHSTNNSNIITLSQCLSDSEMCFTSNTQLFFLWGVYNLKEDFVLQNLSNITVIGNHSTINCTDSSVGVAAINVTNIFMHDINIIHCSKTYSSIQANSFHYPDSVYKPRLFRKAALHFHNCVSVIVKNVSISVDIGTNGLVVVNSMMKSEFKNVHVTVISLPLDSNYTELTTNGMAVCFFRSNISIDSNLIIQNFTYRQILYLNYSITGVQNVLYIIILQPQFRVYINLIDTEFKNLYNATMLYYYYYANINFLNHFRTGKSKLNINNITAYNNSGNSLADLLVVKVVNCYLNYLLGRTILFSGSRFYGNINMNSIITLVISGLCLTQFPVVVRFTECDISHNHAANIMKVTEKQNGQGHWSVLIIFTEVNIFSNMHGDGRGLLLLNTAYIKIHYLKITNNSYFKSIIKFHLSLFTITRSLYISSNYVRNVLSTTEGSYILLYPHTVIEIANNIVYSILTTELNMQREQSVELCYFQFKLISIKNRTFDETVKNFKIILNNIYTAPIQYIDFDKYFATCKWISDCECALNSYKPSDVFGKVMNTTIKRIDRSNIRIIPSSICNCTNSTDYDCSAHEIGPVSPGQTLTVYFIVPHLLHHHNSMTLTVETANLPPNGCIITSATEMLQTHTTTGCNQYNYTVWSDKTECELYLSAEGMPEIFYVKLLPCPVGFSLQSNLQRCHCDTVLDCDVISVTACNLVDGTILRPANSWISADTINGSHNSSHRYHLSSQCPFDYCLPYSSYLNLSIPDMQCQFNRSGVLCGHCQQSLSVVFGSSQCKKCSKIYLFIIIPIAIAGIVLVTMLFVLKLTVTNGTINSFIFYVNIVNTNYSSLLPNCHSLICVVLSIFNLDIGIETCFYSNMSGYAKTCLQLAFPLYLIMIALALIMGSRYSSKVQRLTARRGLHVLATLFLLSYTKILSMVCHVLFFYTQITHLPSRHTQLFWSVDTSVELFESKFTLLFVICLLIFSVLLPFNFLLLFARTLLRFKFVNNFKPLLDVYFSPYKDKFLCWTGLQLLMRAVFFSLSALDNRIGLFSGIVVIGVLLFIQGIIQPFKSRFNNIQESFILLNLLLVYVSALYNYLNNVNGAVSTQYLILIVLLYFLSFILYTCITTLCDSKLQQLKSVIISQIKGCIIWKKTTKAVSFELNTNTMSSEIPDVTFNYKELREPLIAVTE